MADPVRQDAALTHADVFAPYRPAPPVRASRAPDWRTLDMARFRFPPAELDLSPSPQHVLVLKMSDPCTMLQRRDGTTHEAPFGRGETMIAPAGRPGLWRWDGACEVLQMRVGPALLEAVALETDMRPERAELVSRFQTRDRRIEQLGALLLAELESGGLGGPLLLESLSNALAVYLLRRHSAFPQEPREYAGGLAAADLRRALDFIGDALADDLSLEVLAASVHLSPYHFARLFKQSTGHAPHQYVLRRRIERAKELLRAGRLSAGQVASLTGFCDQSQFTRQFKRLTGMTPRAFARDAEY